MDPRMQQGGIISYLQVHKVQEVQKIHRTAKDGRPPGRVNGDNSSIHLLRDGLFWTILYKGREKGAKTLWTVTYLYVFQSNTH